MRRHLGAVFDLAYLALMTNVLLTVALLPMLAALFSPVFLVFAPLVAPGLCAAFAVFAAHPGPVIGTFVSAWRSCFRRAVTLGAMATGALIVLGVDVRVASGRPAGAVLIPVLAVLILLVVVATLLGLVALAAQPGARVRDVVRIGTLSGVRRWYLTLPSLGVLVLFEALFAAHPVPALALAASPLLYVVWANSNYTLAPAFHPTGRNP
ncbi:hypothetical protein Acy02nite_16050 [Actinoplanes cyaneus]|uniref:Ferredoxin-NADPH reductase n=1 Tax=Actinoplanes cyaneus TaxID=52696 RepID=A0A919M5U7_9ACTN|nr:hypothetical protein [Actinoplanes cyaneus]MCW2142119.1 putative membrane protein YesL [Actinoplanes cyaneus]GID63724.1 hypothetical protein Acy02nite_16050 [Actinoplanes cyaneus]